MTNKIDKFLYKFCSDPVKYLIARNSNIEEINNYEYYALCEIYESPEAKLVFTKIERYLLKKILKAAGTLVLTKRIYGLKSESYVESKITSPHNIPSRLGPFISAATSANTGGISSGISALSGAVQQKEQKWTK